MKKRIVSMILAIAMILAVVPATFTSDFAVTHKILKCGLASASLKSRYGIYDPVGTSHL